MYRAMLLFYFILQQYPERRFEGKTQPAGPGTTGRLWKGMLMYYHYFLQYIIYIYYVQPTLWVNYLVPLHIIYVDIIF